MRLNLILGTFLTILMAVSAGCQTAEHQIRPADQREEFKLPPPSDNRYSNPTEYPKETLYQAPVQKSAPMQGGPRGMGPGMGRQGMMR